MKTKVPCHITLRGRPLCQLGYEQARKLGNPYCGHESIAEARRVLSELQKKDHGFKIVRGHCPTTVGA